MSKNINIFFKEDEDNCSSSSLYFSDCGHKKCCRKCKSCIKCSRLKDSTLTIDNLIVEDSISLPVNYYEEFNSSLTFSVPNQVASADSLVKFTKTGNVVNMKINPFLVNTGITSEKAILSSSIPYRFYPSNDTVIGSAVVYNGLTGSIGYMNLSSNGIISIYRDASKSNYNTFAMVGLTGSTNLTWFTN